MLRIVMILMEPMIDDALTVAQKCGIIEDHLRSSGAWRQPVTNSARHEEKAANKNSWNHQPEKLKLFIRAKPCQRRQLQQDHRIHKTDKCRHDGSHMIKPAMVVAD
jgi:hypothetical protein